jgi:hypothetical protein
VSAIDMRPRRIIARSGRARPALHVYAALWLLTAMAAAATLAIPALGPSTAPHPTLRPTAAEIATILLGNARVLAPPFLLLLFGFSRGRASRLAGDLIVAAPLVLVTVDVGIGLGRWGARLLPYLPHLPFEYLAAAVAASAWIAQRREPGMRARALAPVAAAVLVLLAIAAALEVLATPHAR